MASADSRVKGLQIFLGKGSVKPDLPRITIQAKGVFGLNQASYEALKNPDVVEFLYNPEERIIGLRQGTPESQHTYQVRPTSSGNSYTVSGRSFLKFHGIPFDRSMRYPAELVEGILIVELANGGVPAKRGPVPVLGWDGKEPY